MKGVAHSLRSDSGTRQCYVKTSLFFLGNTTCSYTKDISFSYRFLLNLPRTPGSDSNRLVSHVDIRRFADNERVEAGSAGG